ncbi:hypothetical protein KQX54_000141 [Cotesia glomerata]|uniref:Uncharacterized protein n=1 Tax=Cotesia glomerata TaxID=32391 RepID=A0AAV7HZF5_COTGL|nr:hypothetical protein KQX54_000141 [Cotesia glomerata]
MEKRRRCWIPLVEMPARVKAKLFVERRSVSIIASEYNRHWIHWCLNFSPLLTTVIRRSITLERTTMGLGQYRDALILITERLLDEGMRDPGFYIGIQEQRSSPAPVSILSDADFGSWGLGGPPPHTRSGSVRSTPRQYARYH